MMGRTHATAGAVLSLLALPVLQRYGMVTTTPGVIAYTIAGAGAAMLPDFDHRHATIARSLGPLSKGMAIGIETLSGGHRNGTHSILGVAFFTGIAVAFNHAEALFGLFLPHGQAVLAGQIALGAWLAFLFAVATAALRVGEIRSMVAHSILCLAAGIGLMILTVKAPFPTEVLPWAVAIGATSHLLTDGLTKEGVPLLWPFGKWRFKMANLTTDHFGERVIVGPLLGLAALWLVAGQTGVITMLSHLIDKTS